MSRREPPLVSFREQQDGRRHAYPCSVSLLTRKKGGKSQAEAGGNAWVERRARERESGKEEQEKINRLKGKVYRRVDVGGKGIRSERERERDE